VRVVVHRAALKGLLGHTAEVAKASKRESLGWLIGFTANGTVYVNPSPEVLREYDRLRNEHRAFNRELDSLRTLPALTRDGTRVMLGANIGLLGDLGVAHRHGADQVGLYRTEIAFLSHRDFLTEAEQVLLYERVVQEARGLSVTIRTLDLGADKYPPYLHVPQEANPFLGWRGIRVMLDRPELFLEQLRAILRASARKNVGVMFPMISSIKEVRRAKQLLEDAKAQLKARTIAYDDNIRVGVMVEVPAAAVIAEDLAREVSFLSIGTNDLIQYLLAVDRGNDIVSPLYQEFHPAVVRFLRRIIERGKENKVWVGMCGEMAGDPLATILLLGLGLDEFSVVPHVLPEIKKIIRSVKYRDAKKIAKQVLEMQTEDEIKKHLSSLMKEKLPDVLTGD